MKILFDPSASGGGGAFALPTATAAPGEVVTVISTDSPAPATMAPAAPAQPNLAPQIPQGNNAVPPITQTEHNVIIQTEDNSFDPWKHIGEKPPGDPNAPAAPQAAATPPVEASPIPGAITSEDGRWINIFKPNPRTGQNEFYTKIANTPESVNTYVTSQLLYIDQIRNQPPPQMAPPQQAPPQQAQQQQMLSQREVAELARIAAEAYGDDVEVEPIAKFGAELIKVMEQKVARQNAQSQFEQTQAREYMAIRAEDPSFDLSTDPYGQPRNPLAHAIMNDYPQLGAREVYAMYDHWNRRYQASKGNGNGQQQVQQQQVAAPPVQQVAQPDPRLYQRPGGTSGPAPSTITADTPYVKSAVDSYYRMMGSSANATQAELIRKDAIALERAGGNQL